MVFHPKRPTTSLRIAAVYHTRWTSNGNGRSAAMEKAKRTEHTMGPADVPIELIVVARPFTSPRREASMELLMAKEMAM